METAIEMFKKHNQYHIQKAIIGVIIVLLCNAAFGQDHYVVTAAKLNVRKAASVESAIVGALSKGDEVCVHSFKGSWAEIDFKNGHAFVSKKYIEVISEAETGTIIPNEIEAEPESIGNNYEPESTISNKDDNQTKIRRSGALNLAFGGKKHSGSISSSSSTFIIEYESGRFFSTTPVFYNLGLGLYFGNAKSSGHGYSYKASSWGVRVPFHFGYMFGKEDNLHVALRGGVYTNFLIGNKLNKETVKVPFKDRFGWTGSVKATIGYGVFCLTAEYLIPFKSESEGLWMFGLSLGM